jgi:hypothetical protein
MIQGRIPGLGWIGCGVERPIFCVRCRITILNTTYDIFLTMHSIFKLSTVMASRGLGDTAVVVSPVW